MDIFRNYLQLWRDLLTDRRLYQPLAGLVLAAFCAMSFATGPIVVTPQPEYEDDCSNCCCDESSAKAVTGGYPIIYWTGAVEERATDASLSGIGQSFSHSRMYNSMVGPGGDEAPVYIQGNRWSGGVPNRMVRNTDSDGVDGDNDGIGDANDPDVFNIVFSVRAQRTFTRVGTTDTFESGESVRYTVVHNTTDKQYEVSSQHGDTVWHYHDFDASHADYKRGAIKARTDRSGASTDYTYGGSGDETNRVSSATTSQGWEVDYTYAVGTVNIGNITQIDVKDSASGGNVMQRVRYTYKGDANLTLHSDISSNATDGDLLLVEVYTMGSDPTKWGTNPADADFADRDVTMYRYEGGSRIAAVWLPDAADNAIDSIGAVTNPVDLLNQSDTAVNPYRSRSFTYYTGDTATTAIATPFSGVGTENLNTIYGLDERPETETNGTGAAQETVYRVKSETIYTDLGGVTKTYFYLQQNASGTGELDEVRYVTIEDTEDASGDARYRKLFAMNHEGILLREVFIDDPSATTPRYWCTSKILGTDTSKITRNKVLEQRQVSAHTDVDTAAELIDFLDPTSGTNDADTLNNSIGRIMVTDYELSDYESANGTYTKTQGIKQGENGAINWLSYTHYQKYDGTTDADSPRFLKVESYTVRDFGTTDKPVPQSVTPATGEFKPEADDVTTIAYTFHANDEQVIETKTTTMPSAETTENGSDVRTTTSVYMDTLGRTRWSKDGEGNITYTSYDKDTGGTALVVRDVETDAMASEITDNTQNWEAWSGGAPTGFINTDNDNLQLVSKTEYDDRGRVYKRIDAEGLASYTVYLANETRVYPAWDDATNKPLLPIQVTKTDDAGRTIERFALDPSGVTVGLSSGEPTGLDTGVNQSDYISWAKSSYNDYFQLEHTDRYHKIPDTGDGTAGTNYYRDRYTYDDEGRVEYSIKHVSGTTAAAAVEQVTKTEYDRFGRSIRVFSGISDTSHNADTGGDPAYFPLIALTYYDEATPGDAAPADNPETESGVGDSLVTSRISFYKFDAAETRDVDEDYYLQMVYHRNWRQQTRGMEIQAKNGVGAEASQTPQTVVDVDNLGRTIASATYDSALTWSTVTGDADYAASVATDRRTLSKNYYNLLGQSYRSESFEVVASTGATTNKIVSDRYHDRNGQLVAGTSSGSGGFEIAYDGARRQFQQRSVIEIEGSYTSGAYDYQAPVPVSGLGTGTIAGSGGDDNVLSISHRVLNDIGQVLEAITLEADHDDTDGLDLTNKDDFVQSAMHYYFDDAHRLTDTVNLGTSNDKFVYNALTTRASTVPANSDTKLVTNYAYDGASRMYESTDAEGIKARRGYDDLSRVIYSVSNYDNFNFDTEANTGGSNSTDQVTKRVFNALNQVTDLIAMDRNGDGNLSDNQTTTYTFGDDVLASVLTELKLPDSSGASDVISRTYYLDGQLDTQTDQRGTVLTHGYDALRRLEARTVTTLGGDTDGAVRAITYQRDDLGLVTYVTSHGNATSDPTDTTDIVNQIGYTYHDHLGLHKEQQEHDGAVGVDTLETVYHHDTTADGNNVFTKGLRRTYIEYPNHPVDIRQVHTTYGAVNSIDDKLSRASGLANEHATTPNTPGDAIATYTWTGSGRLAKKSLDVPGIELDRITPEANGTGPSVAGLNGLDRFGRVIDQTWIDTKGTGATTDDTEHLHIAHGYDQVHRMLYADRLDNPVRSQAFTYDHLHRLNGFGIGLLERDSNGDVELTGSGIDTFASVNDYMDLITEDHELDLLHNAVAIDDDRTTDKVKQAVNDANELDDTSAGDADRTTDPTVGSYINNMTFNTSDQKDLFDPALDLTSAEFDTEVTVDESNDNVLTFKDGDASASAPAALLLQGEFGTASPLAVVRATGATSGRAGMIVGYKSDDDYWLLVVDFALTTNNTSLIHVTNGGATETVIYSFTRNANANGWYTIFSRGLSNAFDKYMGLSDLSSSGGFPAGRIGLYTEVDADVAETEFNSFYNNDEQFVKQLSSAWANSGRNHVKDLGSGNGALRLAGSWDMQTLPVMLEGVRANEFDITFSTTRLTGDAYARANLVLGHRGSTDYAIIRLMHDNDVDITAYEVVDGNPIQWVGGSKPNALPAATESENVWYRVTCDSTDVTVYAIKNPTEPTTWNSTDIVWETTSSTDRFDFTAKGGGRIGFVANSYRMYVDNLTVKTDRDSNGSYETTEHVDTFDLNTADQIEEDFDYDAAGNLEFDGNLKYTYDAFNRLVGAAKAYRDSSDVIQLGSTLTTYAYDGQNRRIRNDKDNSGALNNNNTGGVIDYFHAGNQVVKETYQAWVAVGYYAKDYIWGLSYIDELVQTSVYSEFGPGYSVPYNYYAILDTKSSVLGLVDEDGDWAQRYEYTPDGRRQVYISAGANDPDALTPTSEAPRGDYIVPGLGTIKAYFNFSMCTIGFQGLMHDEITGNIYQRAREYSPKLGRFLQRDPLGYPDGMNTYAAYHVMRGGVDPYGLSTGTYKVVSQSDLEEITHREFVTSGLHESEGAIGDINIKGAIQFSKTTSGKLSLGLKIGGSFGKKLKLGPEFNAGVSIDRKIAESVVHSFAFEYEVFEIMASKGYWTQNWFVGKVTVLWEEDGEGESINVKTYGEEAYGHGFKVAPQGIRVIAKDLDTDGCDWILAEVTYRNAASKREFVETDEAVGTGEYAVRVRGSGELLGYVNDTSDAMGLAENHFNSKYSSSDMMDAIKRNMIP